MGYMRKLLLLFLTTMILLHSKVKCQSGEGQGSGSGGGGGADCEPLLPPPNGTVSFENITSGSLATYLCDDGRILLGGDETRICNNGVWSSTDPTCNSSILLPYGASAGDDSVRGFSSTENFNFTFFGSSIQTVHIQATGILSLGNLIYSSPMPFPLFGSDPVISPFWNEPNSINGRILFRVTDDKGLLDYVGNVISEAFFPVFSPSSLFIASWVDMPGPRPNQKNTLQAVISTDGRQTYVMFLYHSIQFEASNATIGFNAGDNMRSFTHSDRFISIMDGPPNLTGSSNVDIPGVYIFRVDQDEVTVPKGPPIEGVDFIPFIDLEAVDGVKIHVVTPDNKDSDYFSEPIFVNTGIPIGGEGELATKLYVLADGSIAFQRGLKLYQAPKKFPFSNESNIQVVAPFLADHDPRESGDVKYKVYDSNNMDRMDNVSSFIRNSTSSEDFQGKWMLAAEWRDVPMFGGDPTVTNTYQATVISDGNVTYSVFIYNCDLLNWVGREGSYASIGFSVNGQGGDFLNFGNSFRSQESTVGQTACGNVRFDVPYTTMVFQVGVAGTSEQRARATCLNRMTRDQSNFNVPKQQLVSRRSSFFLRDCPCTRFQARRDNNYILYTGSSDILTCYLGNNFQFAFTNGERFVYKCCYSRSTGAIVSRDREGYGSIVSLFEEPVRSITDYLSLDFQRECCIEANMCDLFYEQRPPLRCSSYRPPRFSACNGDPHFLSLDGALGTFNGWGEYTLSRVGQFLLQGRTTAVNTSDPTSATQFSAIAFGPPGTIVEIHLVDDSLQVFLNSEDITNDIPAPGEDMEARPLSFERISEDSIRTHFSSGVTITVTLAFGLLNFVGALPETLQGIPVGLLGNFNGDTSDDLIYPNGTQIDINSPDALVHDFGQSWMINPEDSLFTYPEGMGPEDFSFPNHVPRFLDEVVAEASQDVMDACDGDLMCIFDAIQTGNTAIGLMTKTLIETDIENRNIVANFPPNITGPSIFTVSMNQLVSFDIYVTDTNFDSFTIASGDVARRSLTRNDADDSLYTFTWIPVEFPEDPIVFLATDTMNASSQYVPRIEFCECMNSGVCTLDGLLDQTANPVMLDCICDNAYEGRFCQDDVDSCRDFACFPGIACTDNPAPAEGATCGTCPQGYSQLEGKCLDIDECAGEGLGNGCAEGCVNIPGGYECTSCVDGYEFIDNTQCRDYDECAGEGSGNTCEQGCVNNPGGFTCTCFDGFELVNDVQCRDFDECAGEGLGNVCAEGCVNTLGAYNCSRCIDGYELVNDTQCQDFDECAGEGTGNTCEQGCVNYPGGFSCTCLDGFELVDDGQCQVVTTKSAPTVPATLPPLQRNNAVVISLSGFTMEMFDADQQELFREQTASGVNRYCSDNPDKCPRVKVPGQVQPSDVILTSVENNDEGGIDLITYVELSDDMVLSQQALLQAVESNGDNYEKAGFGIANVEVLEPSTGLSDAAIGGIIAAAVVVAVAVVSTITVVAVYYLFKKSVPKIKPTSLSVEKSHHTINIDGNEKVSDVGRSTEQGTKL